MYISIRYHLLELLLGVVHFPIKTAPFKMFKGTCLNHFIIYIGNQYPNLLKPTLGNKCILELFLFI